MSKKNLFLIDGHALCYRSFYAIRELTNSKGQATNAVYGFVNTLRKILRDFKPDYVAVCFDSKGKTKRQEKFADYKIQRPKMPEPLIEQIPIIKDVISAFNIPIFECDGFEADDIIATLSKHATKKDYEVTIVTEDKDMFQLADKKTHFYSARKDAILKEDDVQKKLGFKPIQIIDFIGLAGDKADNIPGVQGVGEVTARNLINEFGSVENIIKNIEKIEKASVKEKLAKQKGEALLSKELAILDDKVPIKYDLKTMKMQSPDGNRLHDIFKELEFKRLADEFLSEDVKEVEVDVKTLSLKKDFDEVIKVAKKAGQFAYLLEGEEDTLFKSLVLNVDGSKVYKIALTDLSSLKEIWEDPKLLKITHNCKEMYKLLESEKITSKGETFDALLAGFLLSPALAAYSPSDLAWQFFKESITDQNRSSKEVIILSKLAALLIKELKATELYKLYTEIEMPLSYVLYKMESYGVKLDEALLAKLSKQCEKKIDTLSKELYKMAGEEFNLNSPKQLSVILFEKLGLPTIKKTKTGYSTNESVLTALAATHDFPSLILEYRHLAKLKSTYLDALPKLVDPITKRIHAEFNQIGAETGRISSRHPNLQNIPIRTELGRKVRGAITASDDSVILVAADYSQIELRVLAHLSKDKVLMKAFNEDQDIHSYTASLIFDVDESKIDADMRNSAKRVNFGIVYGMSGFGLAKDLGITQPEAQEFIDRYFMRYPKVKEFMDEQVKFCEQNGYVLTLLNRRRYIPDINSHNNNVRQFAQRQAINTPVQGSAADLMKLAMINVQREIEKQNYNSKLLMTVHDELVFDVDKKEKKDMIELIKKFMENPIKLSVPIKVDVKVGENWLEMEKV